MLLKLYNASKFLMDLENANFGSVQLGLGLGRDAGAGARAGAGLRFYICNMFLVMQVLLVQRPNSKLQGSMVQGSEVTQ